MHLHYMPKYNELLSKFSKIVQSNLGTDQIPGKRILTNRIRQVAPRCTPTSTWFLGPTPVCLPNGISIPFWNLNDIIGRYRMHWVHRCVLLLPTTDVARFVCLQLAHAADECFSDRYYLQTDMSTKKVRKLIAKYRGIAVARYFNNVIEQL